VKYPEVPRVSGVYQIVNLVNGKRYVGSSINIRNRWGGHVWNLSRNTHHCKYLQYSWNKYGAENFEISVLEECPKEEIIFWEQMHMDEGYDYNSSPTAKNCLGIKHGDAVREAARKKGKERFKADPEFQKHLLAMAKMPKSDAWKAQLSKRVKGVKTKPESVEKMKRTKAVLSEETVLAIRTERLKETDYKDISSMFGVSWGQVQRICTGERYTWIKGGVTPEENSKISAKNKANDPSKFSQVIYHFTHKDHGDRICRQIDLRLEFPELNSSSVSAICKKPGKILRGWTANERPPD